MKTHNILMVGLAVIAIALVFFGPTVNVGPGFGLLLLICPLMMLGMMYFMGNRHDRR